MNEEQIGKYFVEMFESARNASKNAYAPYSNFQVGAALVTNEGEIITGCNVENASYGLTVCAERNAIATAIAQGKGKGQLGGLMVYTPLKKILAPCGACRQVIAEFLPQDACVILTNVDRESQTWTVERLLPAAFTPAALNEK